MIYLFAVDTCCHFFITFIQFIVNFSLDIQSCTKRYFFEFYSYLVEIVSFGQASNITIKAHFSFPVTSLCFFFNKQKTRQSFHGTFILDYTLLMFLLYPSSDRKIILIRLISLARKF